VNCHPARRLKVGGPKQRRPDHRVKLEDVLSHHLHVSRPEALGQVLPLAGKGQRGDVVEKGVEPDVHALAGVPGQTHAPLQFGPRERDILEPLLDEGDGLVAAELRDDEVGALLIESFEPRPKGGESEEPVLLALALQHDLVNRAALLWAELALGF